MSRPFAHLDMSEPLARALKQRTGLRWMVRSAAYEVERLRQVWEVRLPLALLKLPVTDNALVAVLGDASLTLLPRDTLGMTMIVARYYGAATVFHDQQLPPLELVELGVRTAGALGAIRTHTAGRGDAPLKRLGLHSGARFVLEQWGARTIEDLSDVRADEIRMWFDYMRHQHAPVPESLLAGGAPSARLAPPVRRILRDSHRCTRVAFDLEEGPADLTLQEVLASKEPPSDGIQYALEERGLRLGDQLEPDPDHLSVTQLFLHDSRAQRAIWPDILTLGELRAAAAAEGGLRGRPGVGPVTGEALEHVLRQAGRRDEHSAGLPTAWRLFIDATLRRPQDLGTVSDHHRRTAVGVWCRGSNAEGA